MNIEKMVQELADIQEIKNRKHSYCYWVDAGISGDEKAWDQLLDRIVDEGRGEYTNLGVFEGKEALTMFFKELVSGFLSYSRHQVHNPLITINGKEAKGRWQVEVPCTLKKSNRAAYIIGEYEETYVKKNGTWMWKEIKAHLDCISPYEDGWVKNNWDTE